MEISQAGVDLIKSFEGLSLKAYKCVSTEKYYTIGYGHYGADVTKDMVITEAQAEELLRNELKTFVAHVNTYQAKYNFNQNQFDALVSFAYNVGSITKLTAKGTRSIAEISSHFLAYTKSGGVVLKGLVTRRQKEKALFDKKTHPEVATPTLKKGAKGSEVKLLQMDLNYLMDFELDEDGSFGRDTYEAVRKFQSEYGLVIDGSYGPKSYAKMKALLS